MLRAPENFPVPPMISDFPKVIPPPVTRIFTAAACPFSHRIVPVPFAVL